MLSIDSLRCQIKGKTILSIDHLQFIEGEFNAILGANGAGKSTFIKAITGEQVSEGKVLFYKQNIRDWPNLNKAKHLAVLPQHSTLSFPFTAEEVVALGLTPLSLNRREARVHINSKMRETDCYHLRAKLYTQLSGGERQRVHLARILLQLSQAEKPPLLLLDEPTSAQDLGQQHTLLSLIKTLCKEHHYTCLAIIHDLNLVLEYCQKCVLLDEGRVVAFEKPTLCLNAKNIERYWGYRAEVIQTKDSGKTIIV